MRQDIEDVVTKGGPEDSECDELSVFVETGKAYYSYVLDRTWAAEMH